MIRGPTLSLDPSIQRWIKGFEHTNGILHMILPSCCLELVLMALTKAPFEPIETSSTCTSPGKTFSFWLVPQDAELLRCMFYAAHHHTYSFPMLVSPSSQGWSSFPRSVPRPTCLGPSLCQQCAIKQMALCANYAHRALDEYMRCSNDFMQDGTSQLFVAYGG